MEWVEVRGDTVELAKELALDQLGVAPNDAEFEVVQAPESKWMGLKKTEARVRARVKPSSPPPKSERRPRRKKNDRGGNNQGRGGRGGQGKGGDRGRGDGGRNRDGGQRKGGGNSQGAKKNNGNRGGDNARSGRNESNNKDGAKSGQGADTAASATKEKAVSESTPREAMSLQEQQDTVTAFLQGIIDGFGVDATALTTLEDDTLIGAIDGSDVGLMVGPKAGTLRAIQEIARTSMQQAADGRDTNRLTIDVGGYRERRRAALQGFASKVAQQVIDSGESVRMEAMSSSDRKHVHDAIGEIDGVDSSSAGQDPDRYVVVNPA